MRNQFMSLLHTYKKEKVPTMHILAAEFNHMVEVFWLNFYRMAVNGSLLSIIYTVDNTNLVSWTEWVLENVSSINTDYYINTNNYNTDEPKPLGYVGKGGKQMPV